MGALEFSARSEALEAEALLLEAISLSGGFDLKVTADGDDQWRRQQNAEMAQIAGRTHNSIWSEVAEPSDDAAERIIAFIRSRTAPSTNERAPK